MENPGDDQGAGWFEVKKKHRSSSKFSIQNWVGRSLRHQAIGKGGNSNKKHPYHSSKPGKDFVQKRVAIHSSSKENEKDEQCLDKCVVGDANKRPKTPPPKIIATTSSETTSSGNEIVSEKKLDIVHKFKWGDLEDDVLTPDHGDAVVSEIRFGVIGDDELAKCGTSRNLNDFSACSLSKDCHIAQKEVVEVEDAAAGDACHNTSSVPDEDSLEENCKVVSEVALANVELLSRTRKTIDVKASCLDDKTLVNDIVDPLKEDPSPGNEFLCSFAEEPENTVEESAALLPPHGVLQLVAVGGDAKVMIAQDAELTLSDQNVQKAPDNSNSATTYNSGLLNGTCEDNLSNVQIATTIGIPEGGESKERFRERLWSFLFENLNRAIDELYLLCELECDLGQVKEAILVLQEAESDFMELNTRVEEFDRMKNSSHLTNGVMLNMKGDHRRPHALSWEVRRMTTSPHRAEILSSSLEAFKKIQEERAKERAAAEVSDAGSQCQTSLPETINVPKRTIISDNRESESKSRRKSGNFSTAPPNLSRERRSADSVRLGKTLVQNGRSSFLSPSSDTNLSKLPPRGNSASFVGGKNRKESLGSLFEGDKLSDSGESFGRHNASVEKEKERDQINSQTWKPMDAWKEKRNWEEILASPCRLSSRISHSPCTSRRSAERARILHDKLMSPEKRKKTALDLKKEAAEKHARAMRIRSELENERAQKLQRTTEKLSRVSEWHAVRSMKLKEGMHARHQRSESRHEAYIAKVVKRAGDESNKVNEVRFITSLNEENKKYWLRQKLQDSEMRRAEKFQVMKIKQKEDMAREEAVIERRKLLEAEKLQRLAETQRRKEEALLRREEERKASSAAREARTMEQLRRKEERAKAQQEEAELLAQRLAERLSESEQRRKVYLEQIRERASINSRDQSSPLMRRTLNKEVQGRTTPPGNVDDNQGNNSLGAVGRGPANASIGIHQSLKRRIKKIRQRLMALKHELPETPAAENVSIAYRTAMATARAKIGRWLQEMQRVRQERKEGASSIGLIASEMIKFLEGKELELQASRRSGLLDFISSALPASHISKPEACQVTIYLLRLLKVVLFVPANRSYFLAQNLLPPLIPMLSAALESYIKIAVSFNIPGSSNSLIRTSSENFDSISEVLDGFLWTVTMIIGLPILDERQRQMQDGLLELVVCYQIIHRLRDLFALYDRPQVEGSPFPSSILLSINLLVVLTSKLSTFPSIDWECFSDPENRAKTSSLVKTVDSDCELLHDSQDGFQLSSNAANPDLSELCGAQENERCGELDTTKVSTISGGGSDMELRNIPVDFNGNDKKPGLEVLNTQKDQGMGIPDLNMSQKDANNSSYSGTKGKDEQRKSIKQPHAYLLSAICETGLVSLPSLLTAVLLQANSKLSSEQGSYVLPSNFEEVATGVLKVLNNLALMDITFMQHMLARPDLKMEFFHIMSFLLTHCTNSWKIASDQVGLLLLESLLLLGYFSLFHLGNQAVLRWGNSPTILHKVCDLPFAFFSDPDLMPILAGTLVAACFGCEQNKGVVQQELSTDMILSLLKSARSSLPSGQSRSGDVSTEMSLEPRKPQSQVSLKSIRSATRNSRLSLTKGNALGSSNSRVNKSRTLKDGGTSKLSEDATSDPKIGCTEHPVGPPLYSRFSKALVDKAEQFFAVEY